MTPGPRTRLIINADDFGLSPAVSAGILEAHAAGSVTSTSMMVGCAGWDDAVARLPGAPALGVGLHFNLLVGEPLTGAPTLMDRPSGRFASLGQLAARAVGLRLDGAEVEAECEAQCAALERAGVRLTHLNSHRHTHALPTVRHAVARVAARRALPLRKPVESFARFATDVGSQAHRALVSAAWLATSAGAAATRAPDHFMGITLQGGTQFATRLSATLDALPTGSCELMVHPGRVDDALARQDGYTWQRELELSELTSLRVRERLRRDGVALISFADL
ncbi:MAG: ChbG/HpnK family deacetylase [Gemmatimonadetes bacterium]|nr:ChbG/HpnK family deacetylase [Gemmatimonadota bacterium]